MVCYQMVMVSVKFQVKHVDLLERAISTLSHRFQDSTGRVMSSSEAAKYIAETGTIRVRGYEQNRIVNALKKAYTTECIREVAKKKKWAMRKKGQNKFTLLRY